jgi:hypothetical protein
MLRSLGLEGEFCDVMSFGENDAVGNSLKPIKADESFFQLLFN